MISDVFDESCCEFRLLYHLRQVQRVRLLVPVNEILHHIFSVLCDIYISYINNLVDHWGVIRYLIRLPVNISYGEIPSFRLLIVVAYSLLSLKETKTILPVAM